MFNFSVNLVELEILILNIIFQLKNIGFVERPNEVMGCEMTQWIRKTS